MSPATTSADPRQRFAHLLASTDTWQALVAASIEDPDPLEAYDDALARIFFVAAEASAATNYPVAVVETTIRSRQIGDRCHAYSGTIELALYIARELEEKEDPEDPDVLVPVSTSAVDLIEDILSPLRVDVIDLQGAVDGVMPESHIVIQNFDWDYQSIGQPMDDDRIWFAGATIDWGVTT